MKTIKTDDLYGLQCWLNHLREFRAAHAKPIPIAGLHGVRFHDEAGIPFEFGDDDSKKYYALESGIVQVFGAANDQSFFSMDIAYIATCNPDDIKNLCRAVMHLWFELRRVTEAFTEKDLIGENRSLERDQFSLYLDDHQPHLARIEARICGTTMMERVSAFELRRRAIEMLGAADTIDGSVTQIRQVVAPRVPVP